MYTQDMMQIGNLQVSRIYDTLPDGTRCIVLKPDNWNGTLLLDLDGASNCTPRDPENIHQIRRLRSYFSEGYAYGGIERNAVGYRFPDAVQMLVDVRTAFTEFFGEPAYTIATGGSRGAFVGRFCMERRPDIFDGALIFGGGGSGEIAAINSKLDGKFILNTLLQPVNPLCLAGIPDLQAEERKVHEIVEKAKETSLGRARLALSAAVEQLPAWADPRKPEPAADNYDAQFEQLMTCIEFAQFNFGSYVIEQLAGGPFSWNDGTDYADLLDRCGRKDFVCAMYEKAAAEAVSEGSSFSGEELLQKDLQALAAAPRIYADPAAVAQVEKILSYTGLIEGPVVNLENIGDQVDPESCKYAYRDTLKKRGKADLLRVLWVRSSGHCNFTDAEMMEALRVLMNRVRTGEWEDLSPERLNQEAMKHNSGSAVLSAEESNTAQAHFFAYHPAETLHAWDYEDWDSYIGKQ